MGMLPIPCPHPAGRDLFGPLGPPVVFSGMSAQAVSGTSEVSVKEGDVRQVF
jgi:hypothetical protein